MRADIKAPQNFRSSNLEESAKTRPNKRPITRKQTTTMKKTYFTPTLRNFVLSEHVLLMQSTNDDGTISFPKGGKDGDDEGDEDDGAGGW